MHVLRVLCEVWKWGRANVCEDSREAREQAGSAEGWLADKEPEG